MYIYVYVNRRVP